MVFGPGKWVAFADGKLFETIVFRFNTSVDPHEEPKRRPDLSYREVYFFARIPYKKLRFGGSPRQEFPIRNYGSWNSPGHASGDRRKRHPLGAGEHAAELG